MRGVEDGVKKPLTKMVEVGGCVKKNFFGDPLKRFQIVFKAHKKIVSRKKVVRNSIF